MPPPPTLPEVGARAIVKEAVPVVATPADQMAKRITKVMEDEGWRKANEMAAKTTVDTSKAAAKIEEIGIKRDASGNKTRTTAERKRYKDANKAFALTNTYLENGYDNTPGAEQTLLRAQVIRAFLKRPALAREVLALTPNQQDALAERILKQASTSEKARQRLEKFLTDKTLINVEELESAESEFEDAKIESDDKQAERNDVDRRLAGINRQLVDYNRPAGGAPGTKALQLDTLRTNAPTLRANIAIAEQKIKDGNNKLDALKVEIQRTENQLRANPTAPLPVGYRDVLAIQGDMGTVKTDISNAERDKNTAANDIQKMESLEQEEKGLEDQRKTIEAEKRAAEKAFKTAEKEMKTKQNKYKDLEKVRVSQEQDLVTGLDSVLEEVTSDIITEDFEEITKKYNEEAEKMKQEATKAQEKAMYEQFQERWLGNPRGFRRRTRPINRARVNEDFDTLMHDGPEDVMAQMMTRIENPDTGANYTLADAQTYLTQNAEFLEKMQPEMLKQLLGRRILSGGISREAAHTIAMSHWGEGMIQQALAKNQEFREAVDQLREAGGLAGAGVFARLAREFSGPRSLLWLLLLVGITAPLAGPLGLTAAATIGAGAALGGAGLRASQRDVVTSDLAA